MRLKMKDNIIVGITALAALDIMFNRGRITCNIIKYVLDRSERDRIAKEERIKAMDNNYFGC